jgi:hypothetical protein
VGTAPASAREALDMVRAGLGYLAAADTGQLAAATQAECLRELEQADAVLTAARGGSAGPAERLKPVSPHCCGQRPCPRRAGH